jgi:TonB family protein
MDRIIKYSAISFLLAFVAGPVMAKSAVQKSVEKDVRFHVNYQLVIAADGGIEKLVLQKSGLNPLFANSIEAQVRVWQFSPGTVNGKPVRTETNLSLTVDAKANSDGGYQVHIADAKTGAWLGNITPPRYPAESLRRGHEAVLRLWVSYDAQGKVVSVDFTQAKNKNIMPFELASTEAAKQWRFLPEKVGGVGIAGSAMVPIQFCAGAKKCGDLLSGSPEKEQLAQELLAQMVPDASRISFLRPPCCGAPK